MGMPQMGANTPATVTGQPTGRPTGQPLDIQAMQQDLLDAQSYDGYSTTIGGQVHNSSQPFAFNRSVIPINGQRIHNQSPQAPTVAPTDGGGAMQQPQQQPAQQPNIFSQSAGAYTDALGATNLGMNAPIQTIASGMSKYENPYQQQVIDTTLQDLERQRQMQINNVGSNATAAGAFGGSRQGVMEAETNRASQDIAARTAAQLRSQGFDKAANLSGQDIGNAQQVANRMMAGGSQLSNISNLGFGMGNILNSNQMAAGNQQQELMQQLINAGKGQTQGYYNSPQDALNTLIGAYSGSQTGQQTQENTKNAGLFDLLSLGLGFRG